MHAKSCAGLIHQMQQGLGLFACIHQAGQHQDAIHVGKHNPVLLQGRVCDAAIGLAHFGSFMNNKVM